MVFLISAILNLKSRYYFLLPILAIIGSFDADLSNTNLTTREQDSFMKISSDISLY